MKGTINGFIRKISIYINSFTLIIFIFSFCIINTIYATTLTVDDDGGADFSKIQDAINAAIDNDSIFVKSGVYQETIGFGSFSKDLTLIGEKRDSTVIIGYGIDLIGIIIIKNFTIKAADSLSNSGISFRPYYGISNIEIANNTIENFNVGIWVFDAPVWTYEDFQYYCYIEVYGNTIRNNITGIFLDGVAYNSSYDSEYDTVIYDAQYNWWGTSDSTDIQQTIRNLEWLNRTVDFSNWRQGEVTGVQEKLSQGIHNNNIYGNIDWNIYVEEDRLAVDKEKNVPDDFILFQSYPNPFNSSTTIKYEIERGGDVQLIIYDIGGKVIKTLVNSYQVCGSYSQEWDGKNEAGEEVSSGIYFIILMVETKHKIIKAMLIR